MNYDVGLATQLLSYGYNYHQLQKLGIHGYTIDKAVNRGYKHECTLTHAELQAITTNTYCKLTKTYYVEGLLSKGYGFRAIAGMLDSTYEQIRSLAKAIRTRKDRHQTIELKSKAVGQYRSYKRKKLDIEMILETLKHQGWCKGMKTLRIYLHPSNIRNTLKRYSVKREDIESKPLFDLKHQIVNHFLLQKTDKGLDELSVLLQGTVTGIGTLQWDRLRNIGFTKRQLRSNKERMSEYIFDTVWTYLKFRQTPLNTGRGAKYYKAKDTASSKLKKGIILFLDGDTTTDGIEGL